MGVDELDVGTGDKSGENRMGEFLQGLPPRKITHFVDERGRRMGGMWEGVVGEGVVRGNGGWRLRDEERK